MSTVDGCPDAELLEALCRQHGLPLGLVQELRRIEKEQQARERRHGINDQLRECIRASITREGREG